MKPASIRQFPAPHRGADQLPNVRNLGILLRLVLGANVLLGWGVLLTPSADWPDLATTAVLLVEPWLFLLLTTFALARPLLLGLPLRAAQALVLLLAASLAAGLSAWLAPIDPYQPAPWRAALLAVGAGSLALTYFELRARALSPALAEARLQALTARIRPHFLFNSLNAVLSLIRDDPQRAEATLENLADLFRALLRDARELVPLSDEIALCRQYLEIEKLRLGERLHIVWQIDAMPDEARLPPLMLQPLLENAIYHGIEPGGEGPLTILFRRQGSEMVIELDNPCPTASTHPRQQGQHSAIANLRERLALIYDLEARLETTLENQHFHVRIVLPVRGAHV